MGKHPISQLPWPVTSSTVRSCSRMLKAPQTNRPAPTTGSLPSNEKAHESEPWKHEGYQKFSEWMASDDDLFVFRRFASTNARIILWMQHQINSKEERLSELHNAVVQAPQENNWRNDSFGWDAESLCERDRLMRELSSLVLHYNKYVEAYSSMRSRPAADDRQINNVKNWLTNEKGEYLHAIDAKETTCYTDSNYAPDLITISSRTRPPLGRWLESWERLQVSRLFRAKLIPGQHVESDTTTYSSDSKFEKLTNRSIIAGGLIMLLTPLWLLEFASGSKVRLGIITAFVVVFMMGMTTATINRPFEVVASSAAYAAVLMVFMQIDDKT